jgi:NitT/TauT family transport system permease protein
MPRPSKTGLSRLFRLGERIRTTEFLGIAAAVFAVLGILWFASTWAGLVRPLFLPSPGQVVSRLSELWASGQLLADMGISIYRITLGFLISTVIALPIGILIGSYRGWEAAIEPFVDFIRYMPVVAFVPLTILWTGTGDAQKFLIIFIGTSSNKCCWSWTM